MVAQSGNDPVNVVDIQETLASQGLLVKYDASGILMTASVTDKPIGVTVQESSRDADGNLEAAGTGTVSVWPLDGIMYIKSVAKSSPKFGMSVYVSQTASANGYVEFDDSNSATFVGYYFGGESDIAAGDLIPVSCNAGV